MGGLIGAFMAILDIQITNASLKDIQGALSATLSESSWISTSYLVAEMIAIPLSGWLSRGLSVRRYLLWTTGAFIAASVLCSFSWNLTSMIVFRALQGFTGGALIPMAFSLIVTLLPLQKRHRHGAVRSLCHLRSRYRPDPRRLAHRANVVALHLLSQRAARIAGDGHAGPRA